MSKPPAESSPVSPLEPDGATVRRMGMRILDKLADWVDGTPGRPVLRSDGSARAARRMVEPAPEEGTPFPGLLARVMNEVIPVGLDPASPGYLAFIPGGGLPHAALADLLTGVVNRYTGLWRPAPALVGLEVAVLRWMCGWVGFDGPDAGGILTSGGSIANLCAVVAARDHAEVDDLRTLVAYCTAQAHNSVLKSTRTAGIRPSQVRTVPNDARFRMDPAALAVLVAEDRAAGRVPFLVVANAGCTPVGAIDPLGALADLCAAEAIWLHVDGAYGGAFAMTARGQEALAGLDRADSITLDPHKGLFLPYGTGAILVRDRARLQRSFTVQASYLPEPLVHPDHWDFADMGPELSRPARGLRIWLPMKLHGVGAFRRALDEKLDLARVAWRRVLELPHVRGVAAPELSLFAFRIEPPGRDADQVTRRVLREVGKMGRVLITGATVYDPALGASVFVARVCVLSFRTHQAQIDALLEDLSMAIERVVASG
ncbi:MAG: decarboxylase [Deltaproteobacteria bacterium]|nr:decarboxylase [Deltaproteobacteria bacterium]HCH66088.1 decarboxylase [Deltaproteobacteria bacterium]